MSGSAWVPAADELAAAITAAAGAAPLGLARVTGGDVNEAYRAQLVDGRTVFVKHHRAAPAGMFAAEAWGLGWLAAAGAIRVPAVIGHGARVLVLEWLSPVAPGAGSAAALGRGLAGLHRAGAPGFGLDHPSFIATIPQDNTRCASWSEHWLEHRLRPLVERAIGAGRGSVRWRQALDELGRRAASLAPDEPPARLHGDLWSGNVHATTGGPALVDPAVYGGPREVDLAMLELFGGLDDATVAAYHEVWPLAPGRADRRPLWQLYPLLVHVVLFGGSYPRAVDRAFAHYL